jgi:hypothetical protein
MAIPSGPGTEVLNGLSTYSLNNTNWSIGAVASGATHNIGVNHILTILSVVCTNLAAADVVYGISVNNGSNDINLQSTSVNSAPLGGYQTFVWNDKFVVPSGYKLVMNNASGGCDWYVSYIDQDWT